MSRIVNISGHIVPAEQALVSAYDHGFLYGDGVYETLRTYDGVPFLLDRHLTRLRRSAGRIRIRWEDLPVDPADEVRKALLAAGNEESLIRAVLTRGVGPFGYDPHACGKPTLLVYVQPFEAPPASLYDPGGRAVLVSVRRNPTIALDPYIKSSNLLNNILGAMEAHEKGADEGIMLNVAGKVAEGSMTNVFVVRAGAVVTPPLSAGILDGLTREFVLGLCRDNGLTATEEDLEPADLFAADEVFITSTTREIVPIVQLDGRPIGSGRPGAVTGRLRALFHSAVQATKAVHEGR